MLEYSNLENLVEAEFARLQARVAHEQDFHLLIRWLIAEANYHGPGSCPQSRHAAALLLAKALRGNRWLA